MEKDKFEIIGDLIGGLIALAFGITMFVGLIKLCIWIWMVNPC